MKGNFSLLFELQAQGHEENNNYVCIAKEAAEFIALWVE